METYLDLKDNIEDRIEEIENYYELNFDKPNSQYFEKGRMKLKKLLMFEPSTLKEMYVGGNNPKNLALIVNDNIKKTIESNNNIIMNNNENKEDIIDKTINNNYNITKIEKVKFIPLKEKKWKKQQSVEKLRPNTTLEEGNTTFKKTEDKKNNNIFINKQSNLYINKNYNVHGEYKKNNVLNKYIKKNNIKEGKGKNIYIERNFKRNNPYKISKSQEKLI